MKAMRPSLIRCPKCQNPFRAVNFRNFLPVYAVAFVVAGSLFILAWRAHLVGPGPLFVIFAGFSLLIDVAVSALVLRRGDFRKPE